MESQLRFRTREQRIKDGAEGGDVVGVGSSSSGGCRVLTKRGLLKAAGTTVGCVSGAAFANLMRTEAQIQLLEGEGPAASLFSRRQAQAQAPLVAPYQLPENMEYLAMMMGKGEGGRPDLTKRNMVLTPDAVVDTVARAVGATTHSVSPKSWKVLRKLTKKSHLKRFGAFVDQVLIKPRDGHRIKTKRQAVCKAFQSRFRKAVNSALDAVDALLGTGGVTKASLLEHIAGDQKTFYTDAFGPFLQAVKTKFVLEDALLWFGLPENLGRIPTNQPFLLCDSSDSEKVHISVGCLVNMGVYPKVLRSSAVFSLEKKRFKPVHGSNTYEYIIEDPSVNWSNRKTIIERINNKLNQKSLSMLAKARLGQADANAQSTELFMFMAKTKALREALEKNSELTDEQFKFKVTREAINAEISLTDDADDAAAKFLQQYYFSQNAAATTMDPNTKAMIEMMSVKPPSSVAQLMAGAFPAELRRLAASFGATSTPAQGSIGNDTVVGAATVESLGMKLPIVNVLKKGALKEHTQHFKNAPAQHPVGGNFAYVQVPAGQQNAEDVQTVQQVYMVPVSQAAGPTTGVQGPESVPATAGVPSGESVVLVPVETAQMQTAQAPAQTVPVNTAPMVTAAC